MGNGRSISDDCERTATVALPTAASPGFISGEVGISAALDAFSTVYELPLMRFKKGHIDRQTDRHTDVNDRSTSLYATPGNSPTRPNVVGNTPTFTAELVRLVLTAELDWLL